VKSESTLRAHFQQTLEIESTHVTAIAPSRFLQQSHA
jgi:hypothetical protein